MTPAAGPVGLGTPQRPNGERTIEDTLAAGPAGLIRRRLLCRGVVQAVGFRPAVHRLAVSLGLAGWVRNDPDGATIEIEGASETVECFHCRLPEALPPLARLDALLISPTPPLGERGFTVHASTSGARGRALIPPDTGLCDECRAEMEDPSDRRQRYAFTTCTNCGPRYSLTHSLPYDRDRTSMACFPLCPACAAEYNDPRSRRFHAEPICCPACGPRLWLTNAQGEMVAEGGAAVVAACAALAAGRILAVKGLGGFQLACRADAAAVVRRLRVLKRRPTKPFAVMARSLAAARTLVRLDPDDARLLCSPCAPILLAPRQTASGLAEEIAPGLDDLGVLLPTTPLHVELFRDVPYPALVMTSGNATDEPICRGNREALSRLGPIADALLLHDRDIVHRIDDSVVRTTPRGHVVTRRSRGWVPAPLTLPEAAREPVLALGGHLQTTACVAVGGDAFLSPHVGDLDTELAREFLVEVAGDLERFMEVTARVLAADLHPDYPSSWIAERLAGERGGRVLRFQHHLAHAAAVLGEHGAFPTGESPCAALILDGTGWGTDGTAWGCELLVVDGTLRWSRLAHATPLPLVGGERAVREPWRVAVAAIVAAGQDDLLASLPLAETVAPAQVRQVAELARRGSWPLATGAGRVFEAAGALCGLGPAAGVFSTDRSRWSLGAAKSDRLLEPAAGVFSMDRSRWSLGAAKSDRLLEPAAGVFSMDRSRWSLGAAKSDSLPDSHNSWEGEAAARFEALASRCDEPVSPWPEVLPSPDPTELATLPLLTAAARRLLDGEPRALVAAGFHATFCRLAAALVARLIRGKVHTVAVGGGCLINRLLRCGLERELEQAGFQPLFPYEVPPGDGGLAYGQAVLATISVARQSMPLQVSAQQGGRI